MTSSTTALLLSARQVAEPLDFLRGVGEVFAMFDNASADSGNVAYGVHIGPKRFFVKTAGSPAHSAKISHQERVAALHNAARLHQSCAHPVLATLRNVLESDHGPLLVYDWADGELLGRDWRAPGSAVQRLRNRSVATAYSILDRVYDAHTALANTGWIAVDFYLGSVLYDASADRVTVIDVDLYAPGPFTNQRGRMYGSTSMMAPEEFERGGIIDQCTNVFGFGRLAFLLLGDGSFDRAAFRGSDAVYEVARQACRSDRQQRFSSVEAFHRAWRSALGER